MLSPTGYCPMSDVFVDDDDSAVATLLERVIRNGKRKRMRRMLLHELFDSEELAEIDGRGKFSAARWRQGCDRATGLLGFLLGPPAQGEK